VPNPVILFSHGAEAKPIVDRVTTLAQDCEVARLKVVELETGLDLTAVSDLVNQATPGDPMLGVHVVPKGSRQGVRDVVQRLGREFGAVYRGQRFDQWIVFDGGGEFDESERAWLREFASHDVFGLHGIAIALRATAATAAHKPEDAWSFCGDFIHLLGVSNLRATLEGAGGGAPVFLVGVASVTYRRRLLARAVAAWHGVNHLSDALAEPESNDVSVARGRSFIEELELLSETEEKVLRFAPDSKTIDEPLRLRDAKLGEVALEAQPDYIRSLYDQMALTRLRWAYDQVDRNGKDREAVLADRLAAELLAQLRQHGSPGRAQRWVRGALEALDEVETELRGRTVDVPDPVPHLLKLEDAIRKLPYPVAVGLRALGLGAICTAFAGASAPVVVASVLGLGLGGLVGLARWELASGPVRRERNRAIQASEDKLRALAAQHVLAERIRIVQALKARLTSAASPPRGTMVTTPALSALTALKEAMKAARTKLAAFVANRAEGTEGWTDYAVLLPAVEDSATEQIATRAALPADAELPGLLWRDLFKERIDHTEADVLDTVYRVLTPLATQARQLADDLAAELDNSPKSAERARAVLSEDVLPTAAGLGRQGAAPIPMRRYVLPDGVVLNDEIAPDVGTSDSEFLARVCVTPLRSADGQLFSP